MIFVHGLIPKNTKISMHLIGESSFELHMQKDFICKASENPKCTKDFRFAPKWPSGAPKCTKTFCIKICVIIQKKALASVSVFLMHIIDFDCRGEHCSSAEKRSFLDFPMGYCRTFALRRRILLRQNPRTTNGRPYK